MATQQATEAGSKTGAALQSAQQTKSYNANIEKMFPIPRVQGASDQVAILNRMRPLYLDLASGLETYSSFNSDYTETLASHGVRGNPVLHHLLESWRACVANAFLNPESSGNISGGGSKR